MIAAILLLIINIMIFVNMDAKPKKLAPSAGGNGWTVYGTMGCGWTRKQLKHMEDKGITHTFVDCDKGGCNGMEAFPTLKGPNGEKIVGYKEV